jgi:hypothetical protein
VASNCRHSPSAGFPNCSCVPQPQQLQAESVPSQSELVSKHGCIAVAWHRVYSVLVWQARCYCRAVSITVRVCAVYVTVFMPVDCFCRREPLHRAFGRYVARGRGPTGSETVQFYGQWRSTATRIMELFWRQEGRQQPELGGLGQVSDCECILHFTNIVVLSLL